MITTDYSIPHPSRPASRKLASWGLVGGGAAAGALAGLSTTLDDKDRNTEAGQRRALRRVVLGSVIGAAGGAGLKIGLDKLISTYHTPGSALQRVSVGRQNKSAGYVDTLAAIGDRVGATIPHVFSRIDPVLCPPDKPLLNPLTSLTETGRSRFPGRFAKPRQYKPVRPVAAAQPPQQTKSASGLDLRTRARRAALGAVFWPLVTGGSLAIGRAAAGQPPLDDSMLPALGLTSALGGALEAISPKSRPMTPAAILDFAWQHRQGRKKKKDNGDK